MSKISSYPIIATPVVGDIVIGTDVSDSNKTKNFKVEDIAALAGGYINVLKAASTTSATDISPVDTPIQVEFGPATKAASDPVMIDAVGLITFNEAGTYIVEPVILFAQRAASKTTNTQFALQYSSTGGAPTVNVKNTQVIGQYDEPALRKTWSEQFIIDAAAGSTAVLKVCASSSGTATADARLNSFTSSGLGDLSTAPASSLVIWKTV